MPNSKRKNAAKARILNNLHLNLPEQPREAKSIPVREKLHSELACRKANYIEIDDTTTDNTFHSLIM